jgi:hypothetical protein
VEVGREVSADGRYVCKTIRTPSQRRFVERVRLFEPHEMDAMLAAAGITVRARYGDYDGTPLESGSPRSILVGQTA